MHRSTDKDWDSLCEDTKITELGSKHKLYTAILSIVVAGELLLWLITGHIIVGFAVFITIVSARGIIFNKGKKSIHQRRAMNRSIIRDYDEE